MCVCACVCVGEREKEERERPHPMCEKSGPGVPGGGGTHTGSKLDNLGLPDGEECDLIQ